MQNEKRQVVCKSVFLRCFQACYSGLWQQMSLRALSSSIRVLFWFSSTATRFSKHFTYSFFFLRHSRAASLSKIKHTHQYVCTHAHKNVHIFQSSGVWYLFFISRTSLLRVASSACCCGLCIAPGDAAITTPGGNPDDGERI